MNMSKTDEFYGMVWKRHLPKIEEQIQFLDKLIGKNNIQGKAVLDAGCGTGVASIAFKKLGAKKVVGIDLSEDSLKTAKILAQKANTDVIFLKKDLLNLKLKDKFDIILSFGVLHHTGNTKKAFENLMEYLERDGKFYVALYWKTNLTFLHQSARRLLRMLPESTWIPIAKFISIFMIRKKKVRRGFDGYGEMLDWFFVPHRDHHKPKQIKKWFEEYGMRSELVIDQTGRYKSTSNFIMVGYYEK
ncbi:MAG TPA: class I SAM-dependent methyltransferase [Candidatus Atribacteria bacterium]|nr:class I SAM-dependent methyltransferase [Candidatus Atribacteria bacterium]